MIEKVSQFYSLTCDNCGEEVDEQFETFYEAVDYKKDNGWVSVKDKYGDWCELCPYCAIPEVISNLKGEENHNTMPDKNISKLADTALDDF